MISNWWTCIWDTKVNFHVFLLLRISSNTSYKSLNFPILRRNYSCASLKNNIILTCKNIHLISYGMPIENTVSILSSENDVSDHIPKIETFDLFSLSYLCKMQSKIIASH